MKRLWNLPGNRSGLHTCMGCLLLFLLIGSRPACALPTFPPVVYSTYSSPKSGAVQSAGCALCHPGAPTATNLNPYGKDVKAALELAHTKTLTAAILHSLDSKDSDGDGVPNGVELRADTLPGDPASKPAAGAVAAPAGGNAAPPETLTAQILHLAFPGNAQHPVLVHFPIGLFVVGLFFDLLGYLKRNSGLTMAGYFNLVVAAITAIASVITGILAWRIQFGGAALQGTLLYHLILGIATTIGMWILLGMRLKRRKSQEWDTAVSTGYLAIGFVVLALIVITGHLGGIVSGVVQ